MKSSPERVCGAAAFTKGRKRNVTGIVQKRVASADTGLPGNHTVGAARADVSHANEEKSS